MKLTKVKNEENVKRGKRAKRKGGQYERDIAKKFGERYGVELKRTPQSGGFAKKSSKADDFRGDITLVDDTKQLLLHVECKCCKTWSLPAWLRQAEEDSPEDRIPIVVFHQHGSNKDYVCLSLENLLQLVEKDKVITKRRFK